MSKSKKTPAKKKTPPNKKGPGAGTYGVWFEFNFVKGGGPAPRYTHPEIEKYYEAILEDWDQHSGESHLINFYWSVIPGQPPVHQLVGEISPPPAPIPHPPPSGGTTTPPSPPPPPPPSLS